MMDEKTLKKYKEHDILSFSFSCISDYGGRHLITNGDSGIYYPISEIRISPQYVENLGFYVHEFSEASIIQLLIEWGFDYHSKVEFKGFKSTYIAHFITPFGTNNGCNLRPATKKDTARW